MSAAALSEPFAFEDAAFVPFPEAPEGELAQARRWRNAETTRRWMYTDHLISEEEHRTFLQALKGAENRFWWLIRAAGRPVGAFNLVDCDFERGEASWGFYMDPEVQGRGLGWLALFGGFLAGFERAGLRRLRLEVLVDNTAVRNLYRNAGFLEREILKARTRKEGRPVDAIAMDLDAETWRQKRSEVEQRVRKALGALEATR